MLSRASTILLLAIFMASMGCVSQQHADELQTLYRKCQEQVIELQADLDRKQSEIAALQAGAIDPNLPNQLSQVQSDRDRLLQALAAAEERLRAIGSSPMLEPELDHALVELARSNPNLMTYSPRLGMVKFQSDLTFALGSAQVSDAAKPSLNQLAQILKGPVADKYEARIVGHTDNVRIGKQATRAKHPSNWHLSVHRSIAVKDVLVSAGLPPTRVGVAGYGEFRPVAPNARKGNQANRRVEIYLVRNPFATSEDAGTGIPTGQTPPSSDLSGQPTPPADDAPATPQPPEEVPPKVFK